MGNKYLIKRINKTMSEELKLKLGFVFGFVSLIVIIGVLYYIIIVVMRFFSESFYCNAQVINKEPEMRTSPGSRGTCAHFNVFTVTIELLDKTTMRYIVPLDTYVDLEVGVQYKFFIEANEIKDYSLVKTII